MKDLPPLAADFYGRDGLALALGPSYHPGGLDLTGRLAGLLGLPRGARVLDIASGPGASARYLLDTFGWRVVGIDASPSNVSRARRASDGGLMFLVGDAVRLPFRDGAFDAGLCECSLCLFGDEGSALRELVRALRPRARVGLSEVTLTLDAPLRPAMRRALAAVACLATAKPLEAYRATMEAAGILVDDEEDASWALGDLLDSLRARGRTAIDLGLGDVHVAGYSVREIVELLDEAEDLRRDGYLGYAMLVGTVTP